MHSMNAITTHRQIEQRLCGSPIDVQAGFAKISLTVTQEMAVDDKGLIHGGFIFGLADYAAMIAVNDPNVVLGAAQSTFKKPVKVGDTVIAEAKTVETQKNKHRVSVSVRRGDLEVFSGEFTCFVLSKHVLD